MSNPKAPSKKGKTKAPKNGQENVRDKSKKKNSSAAFDIGNLSSNDILQLRELLGVSSVQNEGPSVFDLYGDDTYNLNVEVDNDGPYSDVEIVPSGAPAKPLNAQLRDALFSDDIQNKENEQMVDDIPWQLPKLKTPKKGESISASLASLINTACTSQCDVEDILTKYKLPSNCDYMSAPSVNPEIWSEISRKAQTYDKAFQDIQTLIAMGMIPVIKLIQLLKSKMSEEAQNLVSDTMVLLGQAQFNLSVRRRYMIRPFLKKKYSSLCNIAIPITNKLFGDDLNKEIKKCDTSISVARDQYTPFGGFRGHGRGRARGRGFAFRGYSHNPNFSGQYGGRGFNRYHPYNRQQAQFRQLQQFQQLQAPKKGTKSATVTSQNDVA